MYKLTFWNFFSFSFSFLHHSIHKKKSTTSLPLPTPASDYKKENKWKSFQRFVLWQMINYQSILLFFWVLQLDTFSFEFIYCSHFCFSKLTFNGIFLGILSVFFIINYSCGKILFHYQMKSEQKRSFRLSKRLK